MRTLAGRSGATGYGYGLLVRDDPTLGRRGICRLGNVLFRRRQCVRDCLQERRERHEAALRLRVDAVQLHFRLG